MDSKSQKTRTFTDRMTGEARGFAGKGAQLTIAECKPARKRRKDVKGKT